MAFELVIDGSSHTITVRKSDTDDNGTENTKLITDLNAALTAGGVTGVTASLTANKIKLTAADASSKLEVNGILVRFGTAAAEEEINISGAQLWS